MGVRLEAEVDGGNSGVEGENGVVGAGAQDLYRYSVHHLDFSTFPAFNAELTLSPTVVKRRQYQGIGLRRPRATTIVEGMYDRCRELSLVPAYVVSVCEWRGAPCTKSSFKEMAPRDPRKPHPPIHRQIWGWGDV